MERKLENDYWLQRQDSNRRSRGYEPRELPLLHSAVCPFRGIPFANRHERRMRPLGRWSAARVSNPPAQLGRLVCCRLHQRRMSRPEGRATEKREDKTGYNCIRGISPIPLYQFYMIGPRAFYHFYGKFNFFDTARTKQLFHRYAVASLICRHIAAPYSV